jgi:hypothetical protein
VDYLLLGTCLALTFVAYVGLRSMVTDNYQRGEEERQPEEDDATGPTTDDRLDLIFERLESLHLDLCGMRGKLASIENEVSQTADDLEPLRRKLHEVAQKVDHVAGHFAIVPVADIIED